MEYDFYARGIWFIFNRSFNHELMAYLDGKTVADVMHKALFQYKEIIKRSPTIGGMKNPNTMNLLVAAMVASIYKAADGKLSNEQIGKIFSRAVEATTLFKWFGKYTGKMNFTSQWQDKRNAQALESHQRIYPADFVSDFVYGKSSNEYGVIYHECGICKMLKRENCSELGTQMCQFDYVTAKYMGAELIRTKTIANGDEVCNFWFKKNG
jgi:hypothetical protein